MQDRGSLMSYLRTSAERDLYRPRICTGHQNHDGRADKANNAFDNPTKYVGLYFIQHSLLALGLGVMLFRPSAY